jgi:hypothetical protein
MGLEILPFVIFDPQASVVGYQFVAPGSIAIWTGSRHMEQLIDIAGFILIRLSPPACPVHLNHDVLARLSPETDNAY